jgi:hypothetical protein
MRWVEVVETERGWHQVHFKKKVWLWTFTYYCETGSDYVKFDHMFSDRAEKAYDFGSKEKAISIAKYVDQKFCQNRGGSKVVYSTRPQRVAHEEADVVLKRMLAADAAEDIDTVAECLLKLKQIHKL